MFDGVFDPRRDDAQRDEPQAAGPPGSCRPLIAMLVAFAMLWVVAAVVYPEVFAAGLEQF